MSILFSRNTRTASRTFDGIVMVITPDDRRIHKLNETASFIWSLLNKGESTAEQLAEKLADEFDCSDKTAVGDVKATLDGMLERGIATKVQEKKEHGAGVLGGNAP